MPATEAPTAAEVETSEPIEVGNTDPTPTDSAPPPSTPAETTQPAPTTEPFVSAMYSDAANWICRPDKDDLCDKDLDVTVVDADGTTTVEPFVPATDAAADCFYLYPTTSEDAAMNSDLIAGAELRDDPFAGGSVLAGLQRLRAALPVGDTARAVRAGRG